MPLASVFSSCYRVFDALVLSITPHARLSLANEPHDYDAILKRTIREVRFFSETLLTILFFVEEPCLISQTLACVMFSLITYVALESMTGESLHKWLNEIPCGRVVLAVMTKLPAISVLWTLSALALAQWNSLATKIVLCAVATVLFLSFFARLRIHTFIRDTCAAIRQGVMSVGEGAKSVVGAVRTTGRKRKSSDASVTSESSTDSASTESVEKDANASLCGDECV